MAALEGARTFQLVVAATKKLGIGKGGTMPWKLPGDMAYFRELTSRTPNAGKQNAVVMGRKTWESIPLKFRPLPGRLNVILSRSGAGDENAQPQGWAAAATKQGARICASLEAALEQLSSEDLRGRVEHIFVIGGGQVYAEALRSPLCSAVHMTEIQQDFECDTFFPPLDPARWRLWAATQPRKDNGVRTAFLCFVPADTVAAPRLPPAVRPRHEEHQPRRALMGARLADAPQYLELVANVLENGSLRGDRTGTGTLSLFGRSMRFDLRRAFPLLTTKRVFWRGVAEELFWFLRGETNADSLRRRGVTIWDGNSSREYLDSVGLSHREVDDLGPVYGFQWRHFGAAYTDMHADYTGQGVDQLAEVVRKLRTNPSDRRIILSAWNPAALHEMALPPCHLLAQFYVADGELSCQMYQRSADLGLGVPFNIASYALLTRLLAQVTGLAAGELVHVMGDAHVYANHVEPLREQLRNTPRPFPVLRIKEGKTEIDAFTFEDLELIGYNPHKKIAMQMAV